MATRKPRGKMARVNGSAESAQANISQVAWMGDAAALVSDIKSALEEAAADWREVAEEYREAAEASPTGYVFGVDYTEAADNIEGCADDLEGWDPDAEEPEGCGDHDDQPEVGAEGFDGDCDGCAASGEAWAEDTRASAIEHISESQSNIEVG